MAKMASCSNSNNGSHNNTAVSAKAFRIKNVDRYIREGWTTARIADKYGKTLADVPAMIETAYAGDTSKIRELKKQLAASDAAAEKKRHKEEKQQVTLTLAVTTEMMEKSPIELQRARVDEAQRLMEDAKKVADATMVEVTSARERFEKANAEVKNCRQALQEAEGRYHQAQDEVRLLEYRHGNEDAKRKELRDKYKQEQEKLHELCSMPVLLHSSAFGSHQVEGRVFVSQWDYEHLLDDSMRGLVTPVDTKGMNLKVYPDDFFQYPVLLGMEAYNSACQCALAYIMLKSGAEGEKLQFVCKNELVKKLVELQV